MRLYPIAALAAIMLWLPGCGGSEIHRDHPSVDATANENAAKVYFIRPAMRYSGATDRPAKVLVDDIPAVTLDKGSYAMIYLRPGEKAVQVKSYTHYGDSKKIIEVDERKLFRFEKGESYYVLLKPFYRGYRWGTSFKPTTIDHAVALREAGQLKPVGSAKSQPLRIQ